MGIMGRVIILLSSIQDNFVMTTLSPEVVYEHLGHLAEVDPVEGAAIVKRRLK